MPRQLPSGERGEKARRRDAAPAGCHHNPKFPDVIILPAPDTGPTSFTTLELLIAPRAANTSSIMPTITNARRRFR
jgi:hypothetical protein